MVSLPSGDGILASGGIDSSMYSSAENQVVLTNHIHQLKCDNLEECGIVDGQSWQKLSLKMGYGRHFHMSFILPC